MVNEWTTTTMQDLGECPKIRDCADVWSTTGVWQPWQPAMQMVTYASRSAMRTQGDWIGIARTGNSRKENSSGGRSFSMFGGVQLSVMRSLSC